MDIQSRTVTLNPTIERKTTLNPTLERKKVLNAGLERKDAKPGEDPKLRKACQEMESYFLSHLLKTMRSPVKSTDLFGSDKEESMFRDMLDDEVAKRSSEDGGIGIADVLYNQLSTTQKLTPETEKLLKSGGSAVEK